MHLGESAELAAFRAEVRAFFDANVEPDMRQKMSFGQGPKDVVRRWQKKLQDKGWVAPGWPKEYGGTGWDVAKKEVYQEEYVRSGAPGLNGFGFTMVGPVIYTFGTDAQKAEYLPKILSGETFWCQGYSEPGAGSDLASLKTRAVRDGDDYVVNGQKIWTSSAHHADWIFCLVRTSDEGKPQEGISFLLIDMKTPGIEVRPIVSIDELHHLNEVYFTDVRVPVANRIGEENKGWTYAKFLLTQERNGIAGVAGSKLAVARLKEIARQEPLGDGMPLWDDPGFRAKLSEIDVTLTALDGSNQRILQESAGGHDVGARSSFLKVIGTEVQQALQTLAVEAIGYYTLPSQAAWLKEGSNEPPIGPDHAAPVFASYGIGRAATIYGGSNEIQRNVLAKAVLGL